MGTQNTDCSPVRPAVGLGTGWVFPGPWEPRSGLCLVMLACSCLRLGCWEERAEISQIVTVQNKFQPQTLPGCVTSVNGFFSLSLSFHFFKMG